MEDTKIIEFLKSRKDISPNDYDGSYELVAKTIQLLSKQKIKDLGVTDLEMIYFMTIHTGKSSFEHKVKKVELSHMDQVSKTELEQLIKTVENNAKDGRYKNPFGKNANIGMFGAAFFKFAKTSDESARVFLEMCIKIDQETNENKLLQIVSQHLQNDLKGIGIATVSQILHCLKPTIFPVINNAVSDMSKSYLNIKDPKNIHQYAENSQKIKEFRDKNFQFKNFIILDRALYELNLKEIEKEQENTEPLINPSEPEDSMELNQIIYGPPGTGKTYQLMKEYFPRFTNKEDGSKRYEFITFHQSYSYEEFIEGIRPVNDTNGNLKYEVKDGVFKRLVKQAKNDQDNKYAIFIDEINRGNISKIFGELITLLEKDKRIGGENELKVTLPYSGEEFEIPSNLYVIGTMNTADRSISMIDVALRRRFEFKPLYPKYDIPTLKYGNLLKNLNKQLVEKIGPDCQIGHSYFLEGNETFDLEKVMNNKVIPLLQEYFYNEFGTIEEILKNCGVEISEEHKERGLIRFKNLIQE